MNMMVTNGEETITLNTDILWHINNTSFDSALIDVLAGLKLQGFTLVESLENFEAWEYVNCNLDMENK